jgi:SAM-dependent methyltransferase
MSTLGTDDTQIRENNRVWANGNFLAEYAARELRPVEVFLLLRYRDELRDRRILELGCGGGRLTGYLAELGSQTHGIDISPVMIDHCRRTYAKATFEVRDLRDMAAFADRSYDVIVAAYNIIDVLNDKDRRTLIAEVHRVLTPGGLFIMSSHNRDYLPNARRPTTLQARNPVRLAGKLALMPLRVRNARRLLPYQVFEQDYAIVNDEALNFTLLLYYIGRDAQERQLAELGFTLDACMDRDGREVPPGETVPTCAELHYVARPA